MLESLRQKLLQALATLKHMQPEILKFDTPENAFHAVRVMCDNAGLSLQRTIPVNGMLFAPKDIICACVYQESNFMNYHPDGTPVIHKNMREDGTVSSTDWGLFQINDRYHIGPNLDFPSVDYVMNDPSKPCAWMIEMYKAGKLSMWCSYGQNGNGPYKQWLLPNSPMWKLRAVVKPSA